MRVSSYIAPRSLLTISLLIWFVVNTIEPFHYTVISSLTSTLVLAMYIAMFYAGTFVQQKAAGCSCVRGKLIPQETTIVTSKMISYILIIACAGIVLKIVDMIVIKDFFSYASATDFRLQYDPANIQVEGMSIMSTALYPFTVSLVIVSFFRKTTRLQKLGVLLCSILFMTYPLMLGGRTIISNFAVISIIAFLLSDKVYLLKKYKQLFILFAGCLVVIFLLYSMYVTITRLEYYKVSSFEKISEFQAAHPLIISNWIYSMAEIDSNFAATAYTLVNLCYYFTHGFYQFGVQYDFFNLSSPAWGGLEFNQIFKLLRAVGFDVIDTFDNTVLATIIESPGIYTSFFGTILVDFGYFGSVCCFILGFIAQHIWHKAKAQDILYLLVYPYIGTVILHMSFLDMIGGGMGFNMFLSILMTGMYIKYYEKKKERTMKVEG